MFIYDRQLVGAPIFAPTYLCHADGDDDLGGGGGLESLIESIVAKAEQAPPAQESDVAAEATQQDQAAGDNASGDDGAPDEDQLSADDEGDEQEPAEDTRPPIEPPLSWSKEHREHWAKLPRETQDYLHSREQQRDVEVRRSQNEAAEARRALDTDKAALVQERQRYADQLNTYITLTEALDPILAEGHRTDWAKASAEDPAGTQQKWFAFTQRQQQLANAVEQRDALLNQHLQDHLAQEGRRLIEAVPEWADPDQSKSIEKAMAGIGAIRQGVVSRYGYKPEEVAVIRDHRHVLMAKDALRVPELEAKIEKMEKERAAAAKAVEQKKQAPSPRLAASPGQGQSNTGVTSRSANAALRKIGRDHTLPESKRIEAILGQL